LVYTKEIKKRQ